MRSQLAALAVLLCSTPLHADDVTYQRPVKAVANFVEATPIPFASLSPDRATLALITPIQFPAIAELAEPELRLAGLRINPRNHSESRRQFAQHLELLDVTKGDGSAPDSRHPRRRAHRRHPVVARRQVARVHRDGRRRGAAVDR